MTAKNKSGINTDITSLFPDNTTGEISPSDLRAVSININDSTYNKLSDRVAVTVDTILQLKAIADNTINQIRVLGYYSRGDNGGGEFYIDSSDTTSIEDGGLTFVLNDGRRAKRVVEGHVINAAWFGLRRGGNNQFGDQSIALNKAILACKEYTYDGNLAASSGRSTELVIPPGAYDISNTINFQQIYRLKVNSSGRAFFVWRGADFTKPVFLFEDAYHCVVEGLEVNVVTPALAAFFSRAVTNAPYATNLKLQDCFATSIGTTDGKNNLNYGVLFHSIGGTDAGNDFPHLIRIGIQSANIGFFFFGFNNHDCFAITCSASYCNYGYMSSTGYLRLVDCGANSTIYSDIYLAQIIHTTDIIGFNSEHGGRLIECASVQAPLTMEGVRYASDKSIGDTAIVLNVHPSHVGSSLISIKNVQLTAVGNTTKMNKFALCVPSASTERAAQNTTILENIQWLNQSYIVPPLYTDLLSLVMSQFFTIIPVSAVNTSTSTIDLGFEHQFLADTAFIPLTNSFGLPVGSIVYLKLVTGNPTRFTLSATREGANLTFNAGLSLPIYLRQATLKITPSFANLQALQNPPAIEASNDYNATPTTLKNMVIGVVGKTVTVNDGNAFKYQKSLVVGNKYNWVRVVSVGTIPGFIEVTLQWGASIKHYKVPLNNNLATDIGVAASGWFKTSPEYHSIGDSDTQSDILFRYFSRSIAGGASESELCIEIAVDCQKTGVFSLSVSPSQGKNLGNIRCEELSLAALSVLNPSPTPVLLAGQQVPVKYDDSVGLFEKNISFPQQNLSGDSVTPNGRLFRNFYYDLATATVNSPTINPISSAIPGSDYVITFEQPTTAPKTINLSSAYKFPAGQSKALTARSLAKDKLYINTSDGVSFDCFFQKDYDPFSPLDLPGLQLWVASDNEGTEFTTTNNDVAGTGTISTSGITVTGTGTTFTSRAVGQAIIINAEERVIASIASDTSLTVVTAFSQNFTNQAFTIRTKTATQLLDKSGAGNNSGTGLALEWRRRNPVTNVPVLFLPPNINFAFPNVATPNAKTTVISWIPTTITNASSWGFNSVDEVGIVKMRASRAAWLRFDPSNGVEPPQAYTTLNTPMVSSAVFDRTQLQSRLYNNGTVHATYSPPGAVAAFGTGWRAWGSGEFWTGFIKEILVFNRALNDAEIQRLVKYMRSKMNF